MIYGATTIVKKEQKTITQNNYTITATFRKQLNVVNIMIEVIFRKDIGSVSIKEFIPTEYRPAQNLELSRYVGATITSNALSAKGTMYGGITTTGNLILSSSFIDETGTGDTPITFNIQYIVD